MVHFILCKLENCLSVPGIPTLWEKNAELSQLLILAREILMHEWSQLLPLSYPFLALGLFIRLALNVDQDMV